MLLIYLFILGVIYMARKLIEQDPKRKHVKRLPQRSALLGFDLALMIAEWFQNKEILLKSTQWIHCNGKTFAALIGGQSSIWTAEAANAKAILVDQAGDFELSKARYLAFRPAIGQGMIGVNGLDWLQGRRLVIQSLHHTQVRNLREYERHFQNLLARLPVNGTTVDLEELLPLYTMDTITQILLGKSVHWLKATDKKTVHELNSALDHVADVMKMRTNLGPFVHLHWNRKFRKQCSTLHTFVHSLMEESSTINDEYPSSNLPFIKAYQDPMRKKQTVCDQMLTAILAGRDTTASWIGFIIWTLAKNKRVQSKLRGLIEGIECPPTSYAALASIPYLWHVMKEGIKHKPNGPY
jgi:cytochrome P450